ncbi:MAG: DNA primase [Candidatus Omnitrophica bacterium]|nr:DNA primase [Candidatus Omnitrophota bacterium]MDD5670611.1 DNA primase [Candidatus Omnitrophota bacterium]
MKYEERIVEEVQAANDILEVISQYVPTKRAGRNFKGLCPFHQEKTPSFMVNPEKQIFHCFGCGLGGDVFSFLMRYENMSFPEAVRALAERAHIALPEASRNRDEGPSDTERLYEVYRLATEYYHALFCHPERGKPARDYWCKRGYGDETAREFKMGWAPDEWHGLYEFLSKKGFDEALLLKSGLVHRSSQGRCFDNFRGRILFPIHNLQGKVVGFGGRILEGGDGPKYLNSPENPVFHKRRELYGLHLAKKFVDRETPRLIIVEGYMDFMRLYVGGFKTTVATLGTALTNEHVQVLRRFAEEAIVIYDGDKAGEAASMRGLEIFLEEGMNVKLVRMPEDYDPDDFLHEKGAEAFQKLLDAPMDFFDYKYETLLQKYRANEPLGLMKITDSFMETLVKVKNPILLEYYVKRLANLLRLDETTLRTELVKYKKTNEERELKSAQRNIEGPHAPSVPLQQEEVVLLGLMIDDRSLWNLGMSRLEVSDFVGTSTRELFQYLSKIDFKLGANQARVLNHLRDEELKKGLAHVFSMDSPSDSKLKEFEDCLVRMKKKKTELKLRELQRNISDAEQRGDHERVNVFIREFQLLSQQLK